MTDPEIREVVRRLEGLAHVEPSRESTERALGHARAVLTNRASPAAQPPPMPTRSWSRIARRLGGFSLRRRVVAFGSAGAAVALAFLLLSLGRAPDPAAAMEKMAENIRKAKSYKCLEILQDTAEDPKPGEPAVTETRFTRYWLAPGSARTESVRSDRGWKGPGPEETSIYPAGRPEVHLYHRLKQFCRYPAVWKGNYSSSLDDLENLGRFSGKATRELGTREISGKTTRGFEIDVQKMLDDNYRVSGRAEIWLDAQLNLPVLVRYEQMRMLDHIHTITIQDIQWNIDLDPKLFDPTPPPGYTDVTPKPPPLEQQVQQVSQALRIYAEASGGDYPRVKVFDGLYVWMDLCKRLGVVGSPVGQQGANAEKAKEAFDGMLLVGSLCALSPDTVYYGSTIGPKDKEKVVFRWRLEDGRYEVIFGDLRAETVTAEQLRAIEGR